MVNYPVPGIHGLHSLLLTYTGYSVGSNGTAHSQYWETADLLPVITHVNRNTMLADSEMFTDYLFLATAVKNSAGLIKYLVRDDNSPADLSDWYSYIAELFTPAKNLNALYAASLYNGLGRQIQTDVWIALPYPHPKVFNHDTTRIAAVKTWINAFLNTWQAGNYSRRLNLRGFYWLQESIYYRGPVFNDAHVIRQVNQYIHQKTIQNRQLKALWIPYQKAMYWDQWSTFGFDLSILQPSYYFDPNKSLETATADAFANLQSVEMEFDLAITSDAAKRHRFIEYLDKATTGGFDSSGRYFAPHFQASPTAWYLGGWYWSSGQRKHALLELYVAGDPLYDRIWEYLRGTYKTGTAS